MKIIWLLFVLCAYLLSASCTQSETIHRGKLRSFKAFGLNNNSLDFFIVSGNARVFNAPKGKYSFEGFGFLSLTFNKNNTIINLIGDDLGIEKYYKENRKICGISKEDGSSKKYSKEEITKCFNILKNEETLDWTNWQSCEYRASQGYEILDSLNYVTTKIFGLPKLRVPCYGPNSIPIWAYHVANVMHCTDEKFYVLDPFINPNNPTELHEWENKVTVNNKDCEEFAHYKNNCSVQQVPDSTRVGYSIFAIICYCEI